MKQAESGVEVADICRKLGTTETSFYRWKTQHEHLGVSELKDQRQLREENARLKRLVADLSLDWHILQEVLSKKVWGPRSGATSAPGSGSSTSCASGGPAVWWDSVGAQPGT